MTDDVANFTWILSIMLSRSEDLQWADGIHGVHAVVHGDEDLDWLMLAVVLNDCTHLAGLID